MFIRRGSLGYLMIVLVIAGVLVGCANKKTRSVQPAPPSSPKLLPTIQQTLHPIVQQTIMPIVYPVPTSYIPEPLFDSSVDLRSGPVTLPLELQIPALQVNAPIIGVGLTMENKMDAPKGEIGGPIWQTVFWYRGSSIPGKPGTATLAGHVNDPLGDPAIFGHLKRLHPGDPIIVHVKNTNIDILFNVDQVKIYSLEESSAPAVLVQIFGTGPMSHSLTQPAPDDLSHLALITCAGKIINGEYDQHTVVFATRRP
jgi:hypothetical protein